jgi:cytochrome c oxidase cbb3-type subunit 3
LSKDDALFDEAPSAVVDLSAARLVVPGMLALVVAGFLAYLFLSTPVPPAPAEVANDSLLLEGRTIYLVRCATCHGQEGRGDGPLSSYLLGPPVGNLSDGKWKHGEKPQEVMAVISKGVEGTRMAAWGSVLEPSGLRAVVAYLYYLAGQPVPQELRKAAP